MEWSSPSPERQQRFVSDGDRSFFTDFASLDSQLWYLQYLQSSLSFIIKRGFSIQTIENIIERLNTDTDMLITVDKFLQMIY